MFFVNILYGETVNKNGALTAKVLFDPIEIKKEESKTAF